MVCLMRSVFDGCQDVLTLQVRIVLEDLIERSPRPEEFQDVRYANSHSANAGTPPHLPSSIVIRLSRSGVILQPQ